MIKKITKLLTSHWCRWLVLTAIVVTGSVIRLAHTDTIPTGLNRDEAAIAYNAYLLARTGKDEWGRVWPIFLESFGDQKLPGYPYLLVGLFRLGLLDVLTPDFLVRLPSAIAGIGLVIVAYALGQLADQFAHNNHTGLLAAALVSFNPIFIWYSRGAWEANVGLFFWALAGYLIIRNWTLSKYWTVSKLSAIFLLLLLSFLTYNSPLLVTTVIVFFLPLFFWRHGWRWWLPLVTTIGVAVITSYSLLLPVTRQKGGITIFSDPTVYYYYTEYRLHLPSILRPVIGNKYVYLASLLAKNTLASFAPGFWWRGGSHPWHQLADCGHLHLITISLVYASLIYLLGTSFSSIITAMQKRDWRIILRSHALWISFIIVVCLVPSVITTDSPHATRSLEFFFVLVIVASVCIYDIFGKFAHYIHRSWRPMLALSFTVILCLETLWYMNHYFRDLPGKNIYHTGLVDVFADLDLTRPILVRSPERPYEYIKFAWDMQLEPSLFWQTIVREDPDLAGIKAGSDLLNFHFSDLDYFDEHYPQVIWYNTQNESWERQK